MKERFRGSIRGKLMLSVFSALVFMLIITITIFYSMTSYEKSQVIKDELKLYSGVIQEYIDENDYAGLKSLESKLQSIDIYGYIVEGDNERPLRSIYEDSLEGTTGENTNSGDIIAIITEINDHMELRLCKSLNGNRGVQKTYMFYYLLTVIIIVGISIWMSNKISYIIAKPIKDLDFITSRIASGELGRRVKINSNDEIGQLANNFNHMADKLEHSLNEINEKQNKLEAILQSMESGVVAIDNNKNIITINNYAKKLFGVEENIVGKPVKSLSGEIDFQTAFSRDTSDIKEIRITIPSAKYLRVRSGDIIINNHQHIGAVAVIQDITDLKKLENMRTEFVANVSHELKTPLTSIRGFAETLKEVDDEETKNKFLNIINEEAERLTRLISDILLLSHIEQKQEFQYQEFDADKVISDVMYMMGNSAENKKISLSVAGRKIGSVMGDKDKFKQMILNLVDNGIKYSEAFDSVTVTKMPGAGSFTVIVEDTGIGISEEAIPRLFERFYRVDKARSREKGGTGLGLAIVKHIVIGFNGDVKVESQVGTGTKFIITIPYK